MNTKKSLFGRWKSADKPRSFNEDQEKEEAFDTREVRVQEVPLSQIIGSVGRYQDFDSEFRLKSDVPPERLENVRRAMRQGKPLPPVILYQIKDSYYVLDGNHRVAAAKEMGWDTIRARILEFLPSRKTLENVLYRERLRFAELTGLTEPIELTEVGQYGYLIDQISEHRQSLAEVTGQAISFKAAAADWYKTIYLPFTTIIQGSQLADAFPRRTLADLYAYISFHQWQKGRKRRYGIGLDQIIPRNMQEFRAQMAEKKAFEFPEMKRLVTAFVLINVVAGREYRIMEKLFALESVKELHFVPGDFDILLRISVMRDWLTSDSEVIGEFVHSHIRKIAGVTRTQTLIPIASKRK